MKFSLFFFANGDEPAEQYRLLLEAAQFADSEGFSAVWTPERHFHPFGAPFPNPSVTAAAVAATTRRVDIRAGSVVLPLHDPLRVAEEWAMVDRISGGRAGVALASGWNPDDFVLAPGHFENRKSMLWDSAADLATLWSGGTVRRKGPDGTERSVGTYPRPQRGGLPVWITAAGSEATFARAGEQGHGILTHLLGQSWEELEDNLAVYGEALGEAGHGVEQERISVMLHSFVTRDEDQALNAARGPLTRYMRSSMKLFDVTAPVPGTAGTTEEMDEALSELLEHTYREYASTRCLIGSPDSCLPLVERLAELGVDEVACLIDFGIDTDDVLASLKYLSRLKARCSAL
ncbi:MupA/Atu3671 family FMN-dependent luciferase-like monooxygenase [Streptomyces sp. NPDC039022]|uniref:MupA/Atu3671 family FMN-dependent luciferase-like monooxygenase n=1 Tax=unclassified Streptomyces TaxID=2593676 RepID=UPI0033F41A4C